jgi:hypothetical protein
VTLPRWLELESVVILFRITRLYYFDQTRRIENEGVKLIYLFLNSFIFSLQDPSDLFIFNLTVLIGNEGVGFDPERITRNLVVVPVAFKLFSS